MAASRPGIKPQHLVHQADESLRLHYDSQRHKSLDTKSDTVDNIVFIYTHFLDFHFIIIPLKFTMTFKAELQTVNNKWHIQYN